MIFGEPSTPSEELESFTINIPMESTVDINLTFDELLGASQEPESSTIYNPMESTADTMIFGEPLSPSEELESFTINIPMESTPETMIAFVDPISASQEPEFSTIYNLVESNLDPSTHTEAPTTENTGTFEPSPQSEGPLSLSTLNIMD